jgi:predicted enzyme related to lactoylglutathione lyase
MSSQILINIDVPEIEAGISFYSTGLGFVLRRLLFGGTVAEMSLGGARVFLIQQPSGSAAIAYSPVTRNYADHWTPVHLDIVVDDILRAAAQAVDAGALCSTAATKHNWGVIALMRDPFGNGFCLIEFQGAGYDAVSGE